MRISNSIISMTEVEQALPNGYLFQNKWEVVRKPGIPTLESLKGILESKATELDGLVLVIPWASLEGFLAYTYFESSLNLLSSRALEASKYNIQNQFFLFFDTST